jgi:hypothetical protein
LHEVINELGVSNSIGIIPFFNITAARYDLHTQFAEDCTHFCKSPLLWLPMWDNIYNQLNKIFKRNNKYPIHKKINNNKD